MCDFIPVGGSHGVGLNLGVTIVGPTIGDKIVETLDLNSLVSENKRIRTPPLSPRFKVGVFVVFYRQLEQGHNIARRGWGRKAIFPPFEVNKT